MGTVALMGGDEFSPDCVPLDRELLGRIAHRPPRVVVIPTAAVHENPRLAADNGISYFAALQAEARAAMILRREDTDNAGILDMLSSLQADLVYLTGGSPADLLGAMRHSAAWASIVELYREGGTVVGSSAGAMVLGELVSTGTATWTDGLYLIPRLAVLPHHHPLPDLYVQDLRDSVSPDIVILGIQTATAAVNSGDDRWHVLGRGTVSLYAEGRTARYRAGESFVLE